MMFNFKATTFLWFMLTTLHYASSQTPNQDWRFPAQGVYGCLVPSASATLEVGVDLGGIGLLPKTNVNFFPSVLGDLYLEGNRYQTTSTGDSGTFRYDPSTETLTFESGALANYKVEYFYSLYEGDIHYNINIYIPVDNDNQVQLCSQSQPAPPDAEIIVSPYQGQIITSNQYYGNGNLYSFDLHNGEMIALGDGIQPSLAATGELIYVTGMPAQEQFVIRSPDDTTSIVQIPFYHSGGYVPPAFSNYFDPSLSPNGQHIAFAAMPVDASQGLFAVPDSSYHVYVMTRTGQILADLRGYAQPTWTPDGRLVIAGGIAVSPASEGEMGIFITDSNFSQVTRLDQHLPEPTEPIVSPNGQQIAFISGNVVWRIDFSGNILGKITEAETTLHSLAFSPDSSALALGYGENLVIYPLDGSDPILMRTPARTLLSQVNDRLSWRIP
jgi:WD40 repeat protein